MYTIFHTIYNMSINDYTIIISQYIAYTTYVVIISHVFHSCKVGPSLPEASVVEVLSISLRSEESPPGRFGTVTLRISFFWGGGMVWVWWGEIHDLFFHGSRVMFHLCRKFMQSKIEHLFERTFETKLDPGVFKVILTCKVVTYSERLQRFGKKLFLQFCMKNSSYS